MMEMLMKTMVISEGSGAEESGEKRCGIWQQRSTGAVVLEGAREYLSGRHSNAVSINIPGHLLNQATAVRLEDARLSPG